MKKYAVIYHFIPQMNIQLLILAKNEEEAVQTAYYAAHEAFAWPKEELTIKGVWTVGDNPGSATDVLKQKRKEKKYSVPYEFVENNIFKIKCRMGTIVDECIMNSFTQKENMARIKRKTAELERVVPRAQ